MTKPKTAFELALDRVEVTRTAFFASKSARYSDEYYSLLSAWDDAYKDMIAQGRLQQQLYKQSPFPVVKLTHPVTPQEQAYRDAAERNRLYVAALPLND